MDHRQISHFFQNDLDPELSLPNVPLVRGVLFAFEDTLVHRSRPLDALMEEGAQATEAFLREQGMELPVEFWRRIIDARLFAEEKSAEEQEEHTADDVMRFLLQFLGLNTLSPNVIAHAVNCFYAPELSAWRPTPHALETLERLKRAGYRVGVVENHSCDRAFQLAINAVGLRPHLDLAVSSAAVKYRKPDPRIFEIALSHWDILPYELVIAGSDHTLDIVPAIELGALSVLVLRDQPNRQGVENLGDTNDRQYDAVVETLADIMPVVEKWTNP